MTISSAELSSVIAEINELKSGGRIAKIYQTAERELWLSFREGERGLFLLINCDREPASIFLTKNRADFPKALPAFAGLLRKHLLGQRLEVIEKKPNDRMATLIFVPSGLKLYCRFFGSGGFLLTNHENKILGNSGFTHNPALRTGDIFSPVAPSKEGAEEAVTASSADIEKRFAKTILEKAKREALSGTKKELKRLAKLKKTLEREKEKLLGFADYKKFGDICSAFFQKIPRGAETITLPSLETGEDTVIPISPKLSPSENIKQLYKNHRKYRLGVKKLEDSLKETDKKENILLSRIEKAREAVSMDEMAELPLPEIKNRQAPTQTKAKMEKKQFRQFFISQGYEVLVGRNNIENDELVRKSRGNDLWFHISGFPGSHTVLKTGGKKNIGFEAIMETAKIALKYSSRAKDKKGTVVYTCIKNVKKPKGAKPGKVIITHEKTVSVKVD